MVTTKQALKALTPPFLVDCYRKWRGLGVHFKGEYPDWLSATAHAEGYDAERILERVCWATKQVVSGSAAGERDSVLFDQVPYPFPIISVLLRAAMENGGQLSVLDFGGAMGSSYHQCKDFLGALETLHWGIVEQPHYVRVGQLEFEKGALRFYESVETAVRSARPHVILVSGVLQYLPDPELALMEFVAIGAEYIIVDRTPISLDGRQVISTQRVPSSINPSSYPLRLFNEETLKAPLLGGYKQIATFPTVDGVLGYGALMADFKGFIFKKKNESKDEA
jgi:putative methyltransferase (TIGR04325 family)